jgi:beta-aspartyl-peptidase (threonine type)
MEGCGKLNAGIGATRNLDNELELDAMIVDGSKLLSGAIMGAKGLIHPISLARYAMEHTTHTQFAGDGVQKLYRKMLSDGYRTESSPGTTVVPFEADAADTVGCITVDMKGNIACTSSTGGIPNKMSGRIGDSSIFGAGAYANKVAGATATGYGEHIIRVLLSRMVVIYIEQGDDPQEAAAKGIDLLRRETGSQAGVAAVDKNGDCGACTNAKAMPTAIIQRDVGSLRSFTLRDEVRSL